MSMHATSNLTAPRSLALAFSKQFATTSAPRQVEVSTPKVSVTTFHSLQNLCEILHSLDSRFDRHLGVAIELPLHCSPEWQQFNRTLGWGGQLAIVVPPHSRLSLPMLTAESEKLQIAGWDLAKRFVTVDQAIGQLLSGEAELDRCFVLRPEWHDPTAIFAAIGRHLTAYQ